VNLLSRIENISKLWAMILPDIPPPPAAWLGRLCTFPDAAIELAIVRASKKFSPDRVDGAPDPEHAWKFVSAVTTKEALRLANAIPAPTSNVVKLVDGKYHQQESK
jgi:hypothetical protein